MFVLKLFDRKGKELIEGHFVKISSGKEFTFFAEVTWLKDENIIAPFHTFTFHSFEKVDKIPKKAIKSSETRYNIWYLECPEVDYKAGEHEKYLQDWKACEILINDKAFKIFKQKEYNEK